MKRFFLIFLILFSSKTLFCQEPSPLPDTVKYWHLNGQAGLSFSQASFTNWAAGGVNSFSGNTLARINTSYNRNKSSWESYLLGGYGLTHQGNGKWIKNDDKIELLSKYGYKMATSWYYSAVVGFRTQFAPGYENPTEEQNLVSEFMAPAYLTASLGMDYKPNAVFALFLSPVTERLTIVRNDSLSNAGAYGVKPGKKTRSEIGGYVKMIFKKDNIIQNVNLASNLDLFSNYANHPERVDVNWKVFASVKISKLLTLTFDTQLIYDYDIKFIEIVNNLPVEKTKVQWKEVLGLGFLATF